MATVFNAWSILVFGSPNFIWERKLKNTKFALKEWIKQSLHSPFSVRKQALENLAAIQLEMEESEITPTMLEIEQKGQFNSF